VVEPLRAGAYDAFLGAAHVSSFISLAVIVLAALIVGFLLPPITPPAKGDRAVGAPRDATDALVLDEAAHYQQEAAEEYGVTDDERPRA
jgi:hypothetical protein